MTGATNGDERIALFLDYENLAIGAREGLGISEFDFGPVADALAERGRVVARRAYADWSAFGEDRRVLTRAQVELIEIPQRMGGSRKNAADIKMAVDAVEMAFERPFVTTFAIGTGDSDFTPLVHKLRELDKRVIGIGVASSTSALLPPSCDEFLFYDRLPGIDAVPVSRPRRASRSAGPAAPTPATAPVAAPTAASAPVVADPAPVPDPPVTDDAAPTEGDVAVLVTRTLAGLARHSDGPVLASSLKRAMLRKDPTFDEADEGFRGFGELLRHLENSGVVTLRDGSARGDPEVGFPEGPAEDDAFAVLVRTVGELSRSGAGPQLSGLKDKLRKREPDFSEKRYGFRTFLSFAKAARTRGQVTMRWDDDLDDYVLGVPEPAR